MLILYVLYCIQVADEAAVSVQSTGNYNYIYTIHTLILYSILTLCSYYTHIYTVGIQAS